MSPPQAARARAEPRNSVLRMFFIGVSLLVLHGGLSCSARKVQNAKSDYKGLIRKTTLLQKNRFNALHRNSRFHATHCVSTPHQSAPWQGLSTNNLCLGMDHPRSAGQSLAEWKTRAPRC